MQPCAVVRRAVPCYQSGITHVLDDELQLAVLKGKRSLDIVAQAFYEQVGNISVNSTDGAYLVCTRLNDAVILNLYDWGLVAWTVVHPCRVGLCFNFQACSVHLVKLAIAAVNDEARSKAQVKCRGCDAADSALAARIDGGVIVCLQSAKELTTVGD